MARRVNVRLLLWTIGTLAVLAVVVHAWHAYQVRRNAHYLLQRGQKALEEGRSAVGLAYLHQYLTLAPDDLDALEQLTEVMETF
ncbi:MAG: hypothetical protein NZO58_01525, partial [Gemmataceae bacterium]|nr:hypothetical protein [Gemmataceae bacterium]